VCCTSGSITGHRDSRVHCITLNGALFMLQVSSDSRVQCVALLGALEVTGTVGFIYYT
jgi:hypothetical protein